MRDVEIPNWLKGLPLAPEFRPTDTEFSDPIAYISKIEKEASAFGICKVIPPLPKPSKKYVLANLNKSLAKCPELGSDVNLSDVNSSSRVDNGDKGNDGEVRAVFTTRHQELGQSAKRTKGLVQPQPPAAHMQVWQSGEIYSLEQFESKSKTFARSHLGNVKEVSPLVIEALFWKAASEKPIYVEYANDVPGSGFGEPEGQFRYFHRCRRKRTFDRNNRGISTSMKHRVHSMSNSVENKDATKSSPNYSVQTSKGYTCSPTMSSDQQSSRFSTQKSSNAGNEMEGTAGWKLSNSPWNLQVIARSPGSLTRFMPDDIPGVTSPMIYIGMLFSWFAWHVEDHELHSLNFLHTGSPKTWYAVPGDFAFAFEEVIRTQAYGANIDRLAALTLLGEKTTLLSPEEVVASGIPCCRLIQNPGEFVVTFPRAYHIGFSHGFNCGEAANFGTPKWLKVAKDAAVRRAAMNYLPMLSHQQLLYLLTMSFISRVPRSLLPGARSSRLRDRQKEERELLVKKAFIEDILNENNLLTVLLAKNSSYHVVLWDLELLPSPTKESELCCSSSTVATTAREDIYSENDNNQDLLSQLSLYMETVNDLYMDDDDLSCDFQVDSGTLACVACGILGFPFMAVVQPSERASLNILPTDNHMVQELGISKVVESCSPSDLNDMVEGSVSDGLNDHDKTLKGKTSSACRWHIPITGASRSGGESKLTKECVKSSIDANNLSSDVPDKMKPNESSLLHPTNVASSSPKSTQSMLFPSKYHSHVPDLSAPPKDLPVSLKAQLDNGSSSSSGFLRPRIFCLEHAIQIEELLHSKGGVNVLVICHSDFQKIKAHAAAIAEEIGSPFNYNEIPLDKASQEELTLINLAIDDEEHDECGEDWTSKLSINLRHCVKVRKSSPSKQVQHALTLGALSDTTPSSKTLNFKWQSRKSRSKRNLSSPVHIKPSKNIQMEKDEVLGAKTGGNMIKKEEKIIQYSRRNFKSKPSGSAGPRLACGDPGKHLPEEVSAAAYGDTDISGRNMAENSPCNIESTGNVSSGLVVLASIGKSELQHEHQMLVTTRELCENSAPSQAGDSLDAATTVVGDVELQIENCMLREMIVKVAVEQNEKNERCYTEKTACSLIDVQSTEKSETQRENLRMEGIGITNVVPDLVTLDNSEEQCDIQADGDVLMKEVSDPAYSVGSCAGDPVVGNFGEQMEKTVVATFCMDSKLIDCVSMDDEVQQETQTTTGSLEKEHVLSNVTLINHSTPVSVAGSVEVPRETHAAEEMHSGSENGSLLDKKELENTDSMMVHPGSIASNRSKRKRELELETENQFDFSGFIRSPCEGLRPRAGKDATRSDFDSNNMAEKPVTKVVRKSSDGSVSRMDKKKNTQGKSEGSHRCDLEGCRMSFQTRAELLLHKRNRCPHEGCGKKFSSHKYAMLHHRVHDDDRPLKCPWKGCTMSFKWAWARTEHLRVHTGERPYQCKVEGCGLTFRFVSDFSRHRRKTGHYVNLPT
ncbi:hypothetical protein F0562_025988 [Nyssa sinensis]|uniref:JmjC domain-containing protein n=1 Tax=Nyssa sinensis TaxID=561372 RepID=A0A5J5BA71_9ASTE|nr:hypothetical protein F0562_025988 [Nyssa sinensis]